MIFDGVGFAKKIEEGLRRSEKLVGTRLVIFQTGNKESGYVRLKREMGKRLGVEVEVKMVPRLTFTEAKLGRVDADGVLVQLPIAEVNKKERDEILRLIPEDKDVDGLNPDGGKFLPAVVVAVEKVMRNFKVTEQLLLPMQNTGYGTLKLAVVGSEGVVGKALVKRFESLGCKVVGVDKKKNTKKDLSWQKEFGKLKGCEVVISATGQAGLIKPEMVKNGVIAIDLGYPKGDFDPKVADKASFFTPVPGGVGPVTVVSLFENLSKT